MINLVRKYSILLMSIVLSGFIVVCLYQANDKFSELDVGTPQWLSANKCVFIQEWDSIRYTDFPKDRWIKLAPYVQREYNCERGTQSIRVLATQPRMEIK